MTFKKTKLISIRDDFLQRTAKNFRTFCGKVVFSSEASTAVAVEGLNDLGQASDDLSGIIKTNTFIGFDKNRNIIVFNGNIRIFFPATKLKLPTTASFCSPSEQKISGSKLKD